MVNGRIRTLLFVAALMPAAAASAQQHYTVTPIVVPAAPYGSAAMALSQEGWVVGRYGLCCGSYNSWLWIPDAPNATAGIVHDYGQMGQQAIYFTGIQNGYLSWYYTYFGDPGPHGHVWHVKPDGTVDGETPAISCSAPDWDPSYGSIPRAVNAAGTAAGTTCGFAAVFAGGAAPLLTGKAPGSGSAFAINDNGVITGNGNWYMDGLPSCSPSQTTNCADPYGLAFTASPGGLPTYLPWVPGTAGCTGVSINNSNEVVGTCISHPENGGGPRGWIYSGGQLTQIGCSASGVCDDVHANGINNHSVVVGSSSALGAFVWDSASGMRALSSLVDGSPELSDAVAINDAGQILAICGDYSHGTAQPCVLTPIVKKQPSIAWATPAAIAYGIALDATQLDATADTSGSFVYTPAAGTVLHAGANQTLSVSFTPSSPDYEAATATQSLTVNAAPLTVTADSLSTVYGAPVPALTASYAGFVNGDGVTSLSSAAVLSTPAVTGSSAGAYPITVSGAASPDYAIVFVGGTLTIDRAATSVALAATPNPSTVGQTITLVATVSVAAPGAGQPTGSVTFTDGTTSLGSALLDAAGQATLTVATLPAGSHAVTAAYAGDANFAASASAAVTQSVNPAAAGPTIEDLIAKARALALHRGQEQHLVDPLLDAEQALARGQRSEAAGDLDEFVRRVAQDVRNHTLTAAVANPLIAEAQAIGAML